MAKGFVEKLHLQFWDKRGPSKRDALLVLMKSLELLSEALPVALRHIGTESIEVQGAFWQAFSEFNRRTDVFYHSQQEYPTMEISRAVGEMIEQWRETVECRVNTPTGDLNEVEYLDEQASGPWVNS